MCLYRVKCGVHAMSILGTTSLSFLLAIHAVASVTPPSDEACKPTAPTATSLKATVGQAAAQPSIAADDYAVPRALRVLRGGGDNGSPARYHVRLLAALHTTVCVDDFASVTTPRTERWLPIAHPAVARQFGAPTASCEHHEPGDTGRCARMPNCYWKSSGSDGAGGNLGAESKEGGLTRRFSNSEL